MEVEVAMDEKVGAVVTAAAAMGVGGRGEGLVLLPLLLLL